MLQDLRGFAADNLVSARLVLANGSAITVSGSQNPDLFWAIRGAGHNFGIATSFQVKIDDDKAKWTIAIFVFTKEKVKGFFNTWNRLEDEYPDRGGLLVVIGALARNPDIDADHVSYSGSPS